MKIKNVDSLRILYDPFVHNRLWNCFVVWPPSSEFSIRQIKIVQVRSDCELLCHENGFYPAYLHYICFILSSGLTAWTGHSWKQTTNVSSEHPTQNFEQKGQSPSHIIPDRLLCFWLSTRSEEEHIFFMFFGVERRNMWMHPSAERHQHITEFCDIVDINWILWVTIGRLLSRLALNNL